MQSLYYELRIIIFKYVDTPISLILTDRKWYAITQDPYARAEWLIYKYGKTHAIFHAVRLGSDFITVGLVRNLLVRNAIISRYFIQRLLMSIGSEVCTFSTRPKFIYEDTIEYHIQLIQDRSQDDYPPKDGYENSRQLNVIARAILIYPDLVYMWKEIGYYEICSDVNDLVMQGAFLTLFPPTPPTNWIIPDIDFVVTRLRQLLAVGFQLTRVVMEETFHLFKLRLNEIGDLLISSFQVIRNESKFAIVRSCLIKTLKPERDHENFNLLEFLINEIDQPAETALKYVLNHYNVAFKYDANSIKLSKMRSLSVNSSFYDWVLKEYGPNSRITQQCFDDILESRIWIDLKLQENPERDIPEHLTLQAFNSICSIYQKYCNDKVPFKANYFPYLKLVKNEEIIGRFSKILSGLELNIKLPYDINYEYNRSEVNNNQIMTN
ncbi:hypothetical protein GLOIN_2v1847033 [Rhizophagus irregularis DAOM 181602=DAOM 197198]|uniref:Uncharacterized protein n=1 Tax=Rhizophagus irregularis (strain DAOM 181602 / DAOM 197198 / MUCL 43194) TaxID=747089 RepID=A0A2P4P7S3_RHIID|nr:hypothetical protein GLOIN_2v1847033 [Rhizophagus irregularis DAOM 181602=DAOM 197198]POG61428.1 hypothetical protein GLOIN_2v1847033 [Rhizophagus irregularis DAOM 181602=DAOM 197198]|eukprot:XP_025168294.1 hypothetical protein GLOIN_2v1847033 [Rhizophagus irregularis DAOM 181602=DAOM 197198]